MNAPNAAVGALPGWRGTDPDGGTWVLTAADDPAWAEITSEGLWAWRTQEEAEAASLVPLVSQAHVDDLKKAWQEHIESVRDQRDSLASDLSSANDEIARLADAAPAPLDPGNPERFRQAAESAREMAKSPHLDTATWEHIAATFEWQADRLDREHAEAEQDASDRKLAVDIAKAERHDFGLLAESCREEIVRHILAGIRAGRTERQEAAK